MQHWKTSALQARIWQSHGNPDLDMSCFLRFTWIKLKIQHPLFFAVVLSCVQAVFSTKCSDVSQSVSGRTALSVIYPQFHNLGANFPKLSQRSLNHLSLSLQLISSAKVLIVTGVGCKSVLKSSLQAGRIVTYVNCFSLSPQWMIMVQLGTELCLLWMVAERKSNHRGTGC